MFSEDVVSLCCFSMLQQTRELYVITEDSPEAAGDAQVDLLALGT